MSSSSGSGRNDRSGSSSTATESELARLLRQQGWRRSLRYFYDRAAKFAIAAGGISVIFAILLIFFYLLYEVIPMFQSARVDEVDHYRLEQAAETGLLHLAVEEQSEVALRLGEDGSALFFRVDGGAVVHVDAITVPEDDRITSFALASEETGMISFGLQSGRVIVAQYDFETRFTEEGVRQIIPSLQFPFGREPFPLTDGSPVSRLAASSRADRMLVAAVDEEGTAALLQISQPRNLLSSFTLGGAAPRFEAQRLPMPIQLRNVDQIFIDGDQRWLYFVTAAGRLSMVDLRPALRRQETAVAQEIELVDRGRRPTRVTFLLGDISLLVADDRGTVAQWFMGTDEAGQPLLQRVRSFSSSPAGVVALVSEQRRKNFVLATADGNVGFYNTTAQRLAYFERLFENPPQAIAVDPRGNTLLVESAAGEISVWDVRNEHPEVSFSALWSKVWYENYSAPEYVWQSSAATNDFEPKYSLMPLAFGTLKAAFYAMLLATPLAICGAIFTGYFMVPVMRQQVKPLIELMAAMPTVVLGFLAGLWLAPFVERNLLGVFSLLVVLPLGILVVSFVWAQLPERVRFGVPDGWESALLVPVVIVLAYFSFSISSLIENLFFAGDMRSWITNELGITYDQRNALIVGLAMGFAVIPTIFSIAEDAIFTVPRNLTYGSLALGATPWQTLYRVVLPTASPGIFSALMIGFGRAVGETMIVLMATGNTPIMDINIFEGMRTLAANIAVEVPESEVDSTHYRILFLAALVLFLFTFVFNTVAEVVRQRLRTRYSTI